MPVTSPSSLCVQTVIFLIVSLFVSQGVSIKCWICHSDADPKCADPFDNSTLPIKDCKEVHLSHLTADVGDYERLRQDYYNKHPPRYGVTDSPRPTTLLEATMCRKIRQKIHGNWRTIRSCAFLGSPGEGTGNEHNCLYRQGTHDVYSEYCTCNSKDGCNSAEPAISHLFITIAFIVIAYVISV